MAELIEPLPEKVGDLGGARVAAVAHFRAKYPEIPKSRIRVELRSPGEIRVYAREDS